MSRSLASAHELRGRVVAITDGDTVKVLDAADVQHRIRREGIDAPGMKQPLSVKSGEALGAKIFAKDVRIEWRKGERYGRILGHILPRRSLDQQGVGCRRLGAALQTLCERCRSGRGRGEGTSRESRLMGR